MNDGQRINWLERFLSSEPDSANVVLTAWYSRRGAPDGFAVEIGAFERSSEEHQTLRQALDAAISDHLERNK